jgi:hypothetical protein
MLDPSRVTVATVVDDREPYTSEVTYLFASLARFGGEMRRARRRADVIDGVPSQTERALRELAVEVRLVAAVESRFWLANTLATLDAEAARTPMCSWPRQPHATCALLRP